MADGYFPTLVSKDANANSSSNPIFTNLSDGTNALDITAAGAIIVDNGGSSISIDDGGNTITVDGTVAISGTVTVSATDLDIRNLSHTTDSVAIGDGTDLLAIAADGSIAVTDNGASLTVDGTVAATQSGTWDIGTLTTITNPVAVTDNAGSLTVDDGGLTLSIDDGAGSITVDGTVAVSSVGGTVTVSATDLDIRDLNLTQDAVRISANTTANSAVNPIYVSFTTGAITGEVHDYNTAASVAGSATSNHDYTVTTLMLVKSIEVASSGACKAELQVGPVASLVSKWVGFIPKEGGVVQVKFDPPIEVPNTSTGTVRIIRTNREGSSQDLYSTIVGIDA